jgi:hypothetical protein
MKQELRTPLKPLQSGQIWQMEASNLQIELVGKTLVHYKLHKGTTKRTPISLSGKKVLEQYLKQNKAVLVQG